jgi:hypothetical protein
MVAVDTCLGSSGMFSINLAMRVGLIDQVNGLMSMLENDNPLMEVGLVNDCIDDRRRIMDNV